MKQHELTDLIAAAKTVRVHSEFAMELLVKEPHAEDYIISEISRELAYKIMEAADIVTFEDRVCYRKIYDVQLTTIPAGVWLKVAALLKKYVPYEKEVLK